MESNNICIICRVEADGYGGERKVPTVIERYNYSETKELARCDNLNDAVLAGRIESDEKKLPLTVSSKYLNRTETVGLKMY